MKNEKNQSIILITILVILLACNLRAPITGVGSLIGVISEDFSLSSGAAGMLTTIPLLAFAVVSPMVAMLAEKLGAGKLLVISSAALAVGILIRWVSGGVGLFLGTGIIGAAIAVGNVLLPAIIKSSFPNRMESMTSLYTVIMQIVSAVSTAVSVPLSLVLGWKAALGVWLIPAAVALAFCFLTRSLRISQRSDPSQASDCFDVSVSKKRSLYKSSMTWWVTLYMGVQSMLFYSFIAWLSPMMQTAGYDSVLSGYLLSGYVIMGMAGSAALPLVTKKSRSHSQTGVLMGATYFLGALLMLLSLSLPVLLFPGIIICGFCSGTSISFAMTLFGLHTSNGQSASRLSAVAQSIGYLVAAIGPVVLGRIFDATKSWLLPMMILAAAAGFLIVAGKIVGRDEIIE